MQTSFLVLMLAASAARKAALFVPIDRDIGTTPYFDPPTTIRLTDRAGCLDFRTMNMCKATIIAERIFKGVRFLHFSAKVRYHAKDVKIKDYL